MTVYVALAEEKVYTKDGKIRKMDVSNRGKALFDCLAAAIGVDDRHFTDVRLIKVLASAWQPESCLIVMVPCGIDPMDKIIEGLKAQ